MQARRTRRGTRARRPGGSASARVRNAARRPGAVLACVAVLAGGCTGTSQPTHPPTASSPVASTTGGTQPGDAHWAITHPGTGTEIQGYADQAGVQPGTPVRLMVSTTAPSFQVRAYRFGWYDGTPARLVWTSPVVPGRQQPPAAVDARGTAVAPWQPSLTVPTDGWPPGSYLLRLDAASGAQRWTPLVIESPSVAGRVVLLQAVTSYQAYNGWGGRSLYNGPDGRFESRARAVSFDRPYESEDGAGNFFQLEQPLVSLAERLGLPLAYRTGIDLDWDPAALDGAGAVVSEGHDEYWSPAMRTTLTRARDHGSNLAFLGANAVYRKIRFEPSATGQDRVEVNYKIPQEDPLYGKDDAQVTGDWPSPPKADPESSLTGQAYACFAHSNAPLTVADPGHWVWAGTGVRAGQQLPGLVGPESDRLDSSVLTPGPLVVLGQAAVNCAFGPSTTASATYYTAPSGAGVFDAGTENWVCALRTDTCPGMPDATRQTVQTVTATVLSAFAEGPAGRTHPAR